MVSKDPLDPYAHYTEEMFLKFLKKAEVGSEKYFYNNLGFGLLGIALVRADKSKYFLGLIKKYILDPLKMKCTYVTLTLEQSAHFASPYDVAFNKVKPWHMPAKLGSGGLRSTLPDMLKFTKAALKPDLKTTLGRAFKLSQEPLVTVSENEKLM